MKRRNRMLLWLAAGATVLVGVAAWQIKRDADAAPGTLLGMAPASVHQIALTIGKQPTEHYEKRDGHWWRVDGTPTRADDGRLGDLADTAAAEVQDWQNARDFEPAKIGLAPPVAILSLNGQRVEFGETAVTGPLRYVRVGERVTLVSASYTPRDPNATSRDLSH